mgnify:CR=1 FL=1
MNEIPEFGIKRENEERRDGGCAIVYDPKSKLFAVGRQHEDGSLRLFSGGVSAEEEIKEGILREVIEESGLYDFDHVESLGTAFTHYYNSLRKVNRVALATCFLIILRSVNTKPVQLEEHEKFSLAWVTAEDMINNWKSKNESKDHDHWIYFLDKALVKLKELQY